VASQGNELQDNDTAPPALKAEETDALANSDQMEGFYQHLELVLNEIGFLKTAHPRKLMRRLKRLYNRARMSVVELNIMRGVLSGIQAYGTKSKEKE
jgi:tRNA (cytidine32/uridine32-2'-O)-methyltransferase